MSTLVITQLFARPGRGGDVADLLLEILGESLEHEGCEAIRIIRDQDDPDHVAGLTQWTERHNYVDYLAWRTERGFTDTFEAMLTQPLVISYYDQLYAGEGIAAGKPARPAPAGAPTRDYQSRCGSPASGSRLPWTAARSEVPSKIVKDREPGGSFRR